MSVTPPTAIGVVVCRRMSRNPSWSSAGGRVLHPEQVIRLSACQAARPQSASAGDDSRAARSGPRQLTRSLKELRRKSRYFSDQTRRLAGSPVRPAHKAPFPSARRNVDASPRNPALSQRDRQIPSACARHRVNASSMSCPLACPYRSHPVRALAAQQVVDRGIERFGLNIPQHQHLPPRSAIIVTGPGASTRRGTE